MPGCDGDHYHRHTVLLEVRRLIKNLSYFGGTFHKNSVDRPLMLKHTILSYYTGELIDIML